MANTALLKSDVMAWDGMGGWQGGVFRCTRAEGVIALLLLLLCLVLALLWSGYDRTFTAEELVEKVLGGLCLASTTLATDEAALAFASHMHVLKRGVARVSVGAEHKEGKQEYVRQLGGTTEEVVEGALRW